MPFKAADVDYPERVCIFRHTYIYIYTYTFMCMCIHMRTGCVCVCVRMYKYVYTYVYAYTYIYLNQGVPSGVLCYGWGYRGDLYCWKALLQSLKKKEAQTFSDCPIWEGHTQPGGKL